MKNKKIVNNIIKVFKKIKKKNKLKGYTPLHEPIFFGSEVLHLKKCIQSTFVSTNGKFIIKFEKLLKNFTKAKYVVPVVNGTSALHLALISLHVSRNHEVLMASLNFVASANATRYVGATPHFIDSEEDTFGIDSLKLEEYLNKNSIIKNNMCINKKTKRIIKAIIITHIFGHPSKVDKIIKIAKKFKLKVIEDASEGLGSYFNGKHVGTFADIGTMSFNGNKIITTGGGGAILTNNINIAKAIKHLSNTAKLPHRWEYNYDMIGYNYRLPNLNAALGCAQFNSIHKFIKAKRKLYLSYEKYFKNFQEVYIKREPSKCISNYWFQTLVLRKANINLRNVILNELNKIGLQARPVWTLNHKFKHFSKFPKMDLSQAEILEKKIINIPSSANLSLFK